MRSKMLLLAFRDVAARRYQFAALAIIVALGVAIYVCLDVAFGNIGRSYDRTYQETHVADFTVSVDGAPASVVDSIRAIPNVQRATARQVIDTGAVAPGGHLVQARLIGLPVGERPAVNDVVVQSGRYLQPGDTDVALPVRAFADYYHLKPGDTVQVYGAQGLQTLTIAGTVASPEYLILAESKQDLLASASRFGVFFLPETELEQLFNRQGQVNDVDVVVADAGRREQTITAVTDALAQYGVKEVVRSEDQPSRAGTQLDLDGAKQFALLLPALILAVAAFAIYIAMSRIVRAQRTVIGLFRALGYDTGQIVAHYLIIAGLVALGGAVAGVVLGYALSYVLTNAYASALNIPLVTNAIQPLPVVESVLISLLVALLAAAFPAWSAARLLPAPAMRPDPASALSDGASLPLERIFGLGRRPPMLLRLSLRNVWRSPRRALYTIGAVSLALVLLVLGFSTFDSMNFTLDQQFLHTDRWDVAAVFSSPQSAQTLTAAKAIDGVTSAEPVYITPAELKSTDGNTTEVELTALSPGQQLHGFDVRGGGDADAILSAGAAILSSGVAGDLGVGRGDTVQITVAGTTAKLEVGAISDEALGGLAYVSMDVKETQLALPAGFNGLFLSTKSSSANSSVQAALYQLPGAEAVQIKDEMRNDWQDVMGLFNVMIWFVVAFCLAMAAAITFNTMTVNVLDREREIATIRMIGSGPLFVASTLLLEGLFLSILSVAPGLIAGTLVSSRIMTAFNSEFFSLIFHVRPMTYVVVSLLVLGAATLSTLPSIRRCLTLDLAKATKVLS